MARIREITKSVNIVITKEGDWYLARAQGLSIFTEAKSLEDLKVNIREAVALHFEEGGHKKYGLPPNPKIKLINSFEETL